MEDQGERRRVRVELGWKTLFKVMLAVLLAYSAFLLWPFFKVLILSILLAVALYPLVKWACRKGWPRWIGVTLASLTLVIVVLGFFGLLAPMVYRQAADLSKNLPQYLNELARTVPASMAKPIQSKLNESAVSASQNVLNHAVKYGATTIRRLFDFLLMLVLAIYFLIDGEKVIQWLRAFFPIKQRPKIDRALSECYDLVVAYVVGQFITSALAAIFAFVVLKIFHVPMALLLAILAGILDILPIIGVILTIVPTALMAWTVSPMAALAVVALYLAYNAIESYFIVPKVYGRKLRLSTLTVLLSITIAGTLAGVVGAIVILPIVAAYPVIERLWLGRRLEKDTVKVHQSIQSNE